MREAKSTRGVARRRFLQGSLAALLAPWVRAAEPARVRGADALTADPAGLTTYQLGPQIWLRWNNRPVTCYRAHRTQKYPYLYPLTGPASGLSLTEETVLPYPHHRSLFFACDQVNGGNYWQEGLERGQILSTGPQVAKTEATSVELFDRCDWQRPGQPVVMRDERRIRVSIPGESLRLIDWDIQWTAVQEVRIPKTNHSLFSIRAAGHLTPGGGGVLANAAGLTGEKATFGVKSPWCGFHGRRAGAAGNPVEGIALLDHPRNPWSPCPWFTRDYGFLSPTPFNFIENPWTLAAGQSVRLRYRVVLHRGTPEEAGLEALYRSWSET
jgi:hypothetical protein